MYVAENGGHGDRAWYLDNGATNHISNDFNNLNIKPLLGDLPITGQPFGVLIIFHHLTVNIKYIIN